KIVRKRCRVFASLKSIDSRFTMSFLVSVTAIWSLLGRDAYMPRCVNGIFRDDSIAVNSAKKRRRNVPKDRPVERCATTVVDSRGVDGTALGSDAAAKPIS